MPDATAQRHPEARADGSLPLRCVDCDGPILWAPPEVLATIPPDPRCGGCERVQRDTAAAVVGAPMHADPAYYATRAATANRARRKLLAREAAAKAHADAVAERAKQVALHADARQKAAAASARARARARDAARAADRQAAIDLLASVGLLTAETPPPLAVAAFGVVQRLRAAPRPAPVSLTPTEG